MGYIRRLELIGNGGLNVFDVLRTEASGSSLVLGASKIGTDRALQISQRRTG